MTLAPWQTFLLGAVLLSTLFTLTWQVQLRTKNAGIVDAVWAITLGLLGPLYAAFSTAPDVVRALVAVLPAVWGLRLGLYLWVRNHGKPEDGRYAKLRAEWGSRADYKMWEFFQYQVIFSMLISLGLLSISMRETAPAPWVVVLTLAIWVVSVAGEAIADRQLAAFKANPANKGRVCRQGLWKYSRHPNYFFEVLHWVAYLPLAVGALYGAIALLPPLVMAFLLLKLSGIPTTEAQAARTRPEYAEYIRTTSSFIPWFPKR